MTSDLADLHDACLRAHTERLLALLALRMRERRVVASRLPADAWSSAIRDWLGPAGPGIHAVEPWHAAVEQTTAAAAQCEQALADAGGEFALRKVALCFDLSEVEAEVLLLSLLVTIDPRLGLLIACARGAPELAAPTVALALELFCWDSRERTALVAHWQSGSTLQRERLVIFAKPATAHQWTPWLEREFFVSPRLAAWLLAGDADPREDAPGLALAQAAPRFGLQQLVLPADVLQALEPVLSAPPGQRMALLLRGPPGSGRSAVAEAIASHRGMALLTADAPRLLATQSGEDELVEALSCARLSGAVPVILAESAASSADDAANWSALQRLCARWPGLLVWVGGPAASLDPGLLERPVLAVDLKRPSTAARTQIWRRMLPRWLHFDGGDPIDHAGHLPMTAQQIAHVAEELVLRAGQGSGRRTLAAGVFEAACRAALASAMQGLGQRIEPRKGQAKLILPEQTAADLAEIAARVRHREQVMESWGFGQRFSRGRGLSFLLSGPPGTGKSSAVEQVAGELGLVVYRVDLARLTSKYVGETEKNLGALFDQAEGSGMVLLFDEADSLFSARTAVRSSMDRFANQSVNYLLERIEAYEGVAFLTSNLPDALDEAFRRRLAMHVVFAEPTSAERAELWRSMIPQQAPLDPNVRWDELGRNFAITGGYIKNAVLRAAVLAAERRTAIHHELLCEAARRECQALGRVVRAP